MAYKSQLDRFDMERGDVLSLTRESASMIKAFGAKIGGTIAFALIEWFAGNPGDEPPTLSDPRDNGILALLMEHQRRNAERRADYLERQRKKALDGAEARKDRDKSAKVSQGQPRSAEVSQVKDKEEDKDQVSKRELDTLSIPNKLGTATPSAGGVGVNAAPGEVATVYGDEPDGGLNVKVSHADLESDPVGAMMEFLRPTDGERMKVLNTLKARMKQAGRDTFVAVCWRFLKEAETKTRPWFNAACKIEEYCEAENIDHEEFQRTRRKEAEKYELLEKAALDFNPELGEPARILFGMLKAYKTEPTPR